MASESGTPEVSSGLKTIKFSVGLFSCALLLLLLLLFYETLDVMRTSGHNCKYIKRNVNILCVCVNEQLMNHKCFFMTTYYFQNNNMS